MRKHRNSIHGLPKAWTLALAECWGPSARNGAQPLRGWWSTSSEPPSAGDHNQGLMGFFRSKVHQGPFTVHLVHLKCAVSFSQADIYEAEYKFCFKFVTAWLICMTNLGHWSDFRFNLPSRWSWGCRWIHSTTTTIIREGHFRCCKTFTFETTFGTD